MSEQISWSDPNMIRNIVESAEPERKRIAHNTPVVPTGTSSMAREAQEEDAAIPEDPVQCALFYAKQGMCVALGTNDQTGEKQWVVDIRYYRDLDLEYMRLEKRAEEWQGKYRAAATCNVALAVVIAACVAAWVVRG